jgi:hypothetical protein
MKIYKYFNEKHHAQEFLSGKIRFSQLDVFRKCEGERRDELEGYSHSLIGSVNVYQQAKREIFIFSTSLVHTAENKHRFGDFVVEIEDHIGLQRCLNKSLSASGVVFDEGGVGCDQVRYTKSDSALECRFDDIYLQKPSQFSIDSEFRYFFSTNFQIRSERFILAFDIEGLLLKDDV